MKSKLRALIRLLQEYDRDSLLPAQEVNTISRLGAGRHRGKAGTLPLARVRNGCLLQARGRYGWEVACWPRAAPRAASSPRAPSPYLRGAGASKFLTAPFHARHKACKACLAARAGGGEETGGKALQLQNEAAFDDAWRRAVDATVPVTQLTDNELEQVAAGHKGRSDRERHVAEVREIEQYAARRARRMVNDERYRQREYDRPAMRRGEREGRRGCHRIPGEEEWHGEYPRELFVAIADRVNAEADRLRPKRTSVALRRVRHELRAYAPSAPRLIRPSRPRARRRAPRRPSTICRTSSRAGDSGFGDGSPPGAPDGPARGRGCPEAGR
jgi:hypothetical protein